jgi:hypothetical protein
MVYSHHLHVRPLTTLIFFLAIVMVIVLNTSAAGCGFKPKNITFILAALQHYRARAMTGWLKIRIMLSYMSTHRLLFQ